MDPKAKSGAYIKEWMESVGLIQADLCKKLGWSKAKASAVWNGEQRYNEDMLNEVGLLVKALPRELLMPPEEAHRKRRIEIELRRVAEEEAQRQRAEAEEAQRRSLEDAVRKRAANGGQ